MQHGHNKRSLIAVAAIFVAVLVLANLFGAGALIFLVLLCPIMMFVMMFGMNNNHKR